jgi:hypothetical protein
MMDEDELLEITLYVPATDIDFVENIQAVIERLMWDESLRTQLFAKDPKDNQAEWDQLFNNA